MRLKIWTSVGRPLVNKLLLVPTQLLFSSGLLIHLDVLKMSLEVRTS